MRPTCMHVCPYASRLYAHTERSTAVHVWGARAQVHSFVSLGIRMTMVMRPLPEGFSAHNASPLVTDNGSRNCSLPVAAPFLRLSPFSRVYFLYFSRWRTVISDSRPLTDSVRKLRSLRNDDLTN